MATCLFGMVVIIGQTKKRVDITTGAFGLCKFYLNISHPSFKLISTIDSQFLNPNLDASSPFLSHSIPIASSSFSYPQARNYNSPHFNSFLFFSF